MPKAWSIIKLYRTRLAGQAGFLAIEVLLAATILGFLVIALSGSIIYGRQATANSGERARAVYLAEEGVEAARNIRNAAFSNLADGTFGIAQSGGVWTFSGSSDTTGIFTRQITIATVDAVRKTVTTNVTWPQGASTTSVSLVTRLTNWLASIKSWLNAIQSGSLDLAGNQDGRKVATAGNYAYVVRNGGTPNFAIIDISNPATPTLTGSLTLAGSPTNIFVSGNFAYISSDNNSSELQIINITNPAAPVSAGNFDAGGNIDALAVFVSGNTAYLTRASNGSTAEFNIVDVTNPASPTLTGSYDNNIDMTDVVVSGTNAFVGTNSATAEILVVNIAVPASPVLATSYNLATAGTVNAIKLFGSTLLIGQNNTLSIYNVTNPLAAVSLGTVTTTGSARVNDIDVDSTNTFAFLSTNHNPAEFQIANISVPVSASIVRTVDVAGNSELSGLAYNTSLDIVVGVSVSNTQEIVTFIKN